MKAFNLKDRLGRLAAATAVAASTALTATPASALSWSLGDADVSLQNSLSAGVAFRTRDRDSRLVGIANGGSLFSTNSDDGNLAFDNGEMVTSPIKLKSELSVSWGDFGLFARGAVGYNPVLEDHDLFDPADYGAGKEFDEAERQRKLDLARDDVSTYAELLDAYVYGNFDVFDRFLSLRVGRQVINWGESTLVQNGLNSLLALNANRLRNPGFELDEVIIPANMVWAAVDLTDHASIEGFYQLGWEKTVPDSSGTFFATNDFAFNGGTQANIGFGRPGENTGNCGVSPQDPACAAAPFGSTVPRAGDREPDDHGQVGGALRLYIPPLNDMDMALYMANYHSRLPVFSGISRGGPASPADDAAYFVEYPEDIQLYGMSFSTSVWGLAFQGEYSYKAGQPLQLDDVELLLAGLGVSSQLAPVPGSALGNQELRGWRRHDVSQVDLSVTKIIGPSDAFGSDQLTLLLEVAWMNVHGMPEPDELRYEAPNTSLPSNPAVAAFFAVPTETRSYATDFSAGYKAVARWQYNNAFGALNLEPTLLWQHDTKGYSPAPIVNFIEGRQSATFILGWDYLSAWSGNLAYQRNYGGGIQNLSRDRDFLAAHIKYSF